MTDRPNVLLILTDEQRLSTMSAYGATPCRTPHLDKLASESVVFENAYTSCPVCSPARASIMTGLFPHNHGFTSNAGNLGCSVSELPDSPILLSRMLERAGYQLGYTGKWHLGTNPVERKAAFFDGYGRAAGRVSAKENPYRLPDDVRYRHIVPSHVGFQGHDFAGHGGGGFRYSQYQAYLRDHGYEHRVTDEWKIGPQRAGILAGPLEATVPYFLTTESIGLIDRFTAAAAEPEPFFLWHNFWGPHAPYYMTREFYDLYEGVEIPEWPNFRWPARKTAGPHRMMMKAGARDMEWSDWAAYIRYYYAFMTMIDSQIGRLMDHLCDSGLLENTVIIFAADHGEALGGHGGIYNKGQTHFEEIQRIPFLIRLPGGARGGGRVNELVSLVDIYPTVCDLAGASFERDRCDGESLRPLLDGSAGSWRESVAVEYNGLGNACQTMRTIRNDRFKYGFTFGSSEELYDLEADPHEMVNLASDSAYRKDKREARDQLLHWMHETGDFGVINHLREYIGLVE